MILETICKCPPTKPNVELTIIPMIGENVSKRILSCGEQEAYSLMNFARCCSVSIIAQGN